MQKTAIFSSLLNHYVKRLIIFQKKICLNTKFNNITKNSISIYNKKLSLSIPDNKNILTGS